MKILRRTAAAVATGGLLALCAAASAQSGSQDSVTHFTRADGTPVTLISGQPKPVSYGPKPAFEQLDSNHDGSISRAEAEAFVPLSNDFDFLAHKSERISKRAYEHWDYR